MARGIDLATPLTATTARLVAQNGNEFVCRYLVPEKYKWKRLTRQEAEVITNEGMKIVSIFETSADRSAKGSEAGQIDGMLALIEVNKIAQPENTSIYFAVDFNAQAFHFDGIEKYLQAAAAEIPLYNIGVYGSYRVIEEMAKRKAAKHFWQTYAWSGDQKSVHANIYQYRNSVRLGNLIVDENFSSKNEGWWDTNPVSNIVPWAAIAVQKAVDMEVISNPEMLTESEQKMLVILDRLNLLKKPTAG